MQRFLPPGMSTNALFPAASSVYPKTVTDRLHYVWRCKLGSSISAGIKRPATFALPGSACRYLRVLCGLSLRRRLAPDCRARASLCAILAAGIKQLGHEVLSECYFDTLVIHVPNRAKRFAAHADEANINLRIIDADHIGISLDETTTRKILRDLWQVLHPQPRTFLISMC